jgi:hypothetical protein
MRTHEPDAQLVKAYDILDHLRLRDLAGAVVVVEEEQEMEVPPGKDAQDPCAVDYMHVSCCACQDVLPPPLYARAHAWRCHGCIHRRAHACHDRLLVLLTNAAVVMRT